MGKKIIDSFFKRISPQSVQHSTAAEPSQSTVEPEYRPFKISRVQLNKFDPSSLIRDPRLRQPIGDYPNSQCDEVQRAYLNSGPYQPELSKVLIQNFREDGQVPLLEKFTLFCEKYGITVPDMSATYTAGRGHVRKDPITPGHHFQVDIFMGTIDSQLQELNTRFKEDTVELLNLSTVLDPRDRFKSFKVEDICKLAEKNYPSDFTEHEKLHLRFQLQNYELGVFKHPEFQSLTTISELCQVLNKTRKSIIYPLIDKLIRLVLTLPVSTSTTERVFSATKLVKTRLHNRMDDDFLSSFLITYIERDIARSFDVDSIIDTFNDMKERRAQFQMPQFSR